MAGVRLLRLALAGGGTVSGCGRAAVAAGEEEEIAHKGDDESSLEYECTVIPLGLN
jgi:hypothetical protein